MGDKNIETFSASEEKDFDSYQNKPSLVTRLTRVNKKCKNQSKFQDKQKNNLVADMDDSYLTNFQKNDDNFSSNLNRKRRRLNDDEILSNGSI